MAGKTAYVTGGASGIGQAVSEMLASKGIKVCVGDMNLEGAQKTASQLGNGAMAVQVNAADWDSQLAAFEKAVDAFGRLDYVFPIAGIGERAAIKNDPKATRFQKPDLAVVDVDLTGVLYTSFLAVQQMRRQEKDKDGFRGKIAVTASVCGFYCVPTVPVYTAAKHGVVGFVRSYGKYLPEEGMTLNAVCPNVVRTSISTPAFYDKVDEQGVLTSIKDVVDAFASFLDTDTSGECMEVGPNGGFTPKAQAPHLDKETTSILNMIEQRSHRLHEPEPDAGV
ncbi:uncharacterized protein LTR77_003787 [Saxophila tyrrhenica]|uniref:Uncharacterized protein n=1 Tax=Saxophila tyrrhenica TaxID=1690608 RepID=A0AAV9PIX3_9PEZI|nr:hypothetical protein LTR77_003787 [Saxophila tyrrhenica]